MHVDGIKVIYKYVTIGEIDRALYGTSYNIIYNIKQQNENMSHRNGY